MKQFLLNLHPTIKGIILAFLATLGMANVYVFSKAALLEVNYFQFQFYWFAFALLWTLPFLIITGMIKKIPRLSRKSNISLVIIGILELSAASLLFLAIKLAENPTIISFLSNLTPIFVTLLGIRFLGERFNLIEAVGIILTIGGVILITYTRDTSLKDFFGHGSGWILLSSVFSSISIITAKSRIKDIHPGILTLNRIIFIFTAATIAIILRSESLAVPGRALFNMAAGSLLGPFLTAMAQYSALKYIEASRTMIIQSTRSLFVLIGSMMYLSILPTSLQITGGIITILGVIVMTMGKMQFNIKKRPGIPSRASESIPS
ncbi:MAG: DMT family transporter [Bacteroidales bacterium]|nr:DMT family transporter [Bacteroidales bacterium]MBN2699607.1 DMT family transporter [Bacteroidales bacterium]